MALRELKKAQVKDILRYIRKLREKEFEQICITSQTSFTQKQKRIYEKSDY